MEAEVGQNELTLVSHSSRKRLSIGPANAIMQYSYSCPSMPNQTSTNSAVIFCKLCKLKQLYFIGRAHVLFKHVIAPYLGKSPLDCLIRGITYHVTKRYIIHFKLGKESISK